MHGTAVLILLRTLFLFGIASTKVLLSKPVTYPSLAVTSNPINLNFTLSDNATIQVRQNGQSEDVLPVTMLMKEYKMDEETGKGQSLGILKLMWDKKECVIEMEEAGRGSVADKLPLNEFTHEFNNITLAFGNEDTGRYLKIYWNSIPLIQWDITVDPSKIDLIEFRFGHINDLFITVTDGNEFVPIVDEITSEPNEDGSGTMEPREGDSGDIRSGVEYSVLALLIVLMTL